MTSQPRKDLIIFDLDETLVDLNMNINIMRESILNMFEVHHIKPMLQPLYQGIAETTALIKKTNCELALTLEKDIWEWITAYERECAITHATIRAGAIDLLESLSHHHLAVYSNNHQLAVEEALEAMGMKHTWFCAIVGRYAHQTLKPSPEPIINTINQLGLDNLHHIFFIGDSHYDAMCVKNAQDYLGSLKKIHFVGIHPVAEKLKALKKMGASYVVKDHVELKELLMSEKR